MNVLNNQYAEYLTALNYPSVPTLFLDLEAFQKNSQWIKENALGKKIRIATKSIRSRHVLKTILDSDKVFQGLMTYDIREAIWLRDLGFKDILMGYPTMDVLGIRELLKNPLGITLMVDLPEHLDILEREAIIAGKKVTVCIDIDLSMNLPGLRFGVYRSTINSVERMKTFLKKLKSCHHLKLIGVMGYEAQIAGVMDKESLLIRTLKTLSLNQLKERRKSMVQLILSEGHALEFINGGGTGSLKETCQEKVVTEVTVGSGFFAPVIFDHYKGFTLTPSLLFTLPIVRHPEKSIFTCFGGGYIASGSTDRIKQPTPYLPEGMSLLKHEGAGEVQTPFRYNGPLNLVPGDSIILRHAKSGEICERFPDIVIIDKGLEKTRVPTYRGEGKNFV